MVCTKMEVNVWVDIKKCAVSVDMITRIDAKSTKHAKKQQQVMTWHGRHGSQQQQVFLLGMILVGFIYVYTLDVCGNKGFYLFLNSISCHCIALRHLWSVRFRNNGTVRCNDNISSHGWYWASYHYLLLLLEAFHPMWDVWDALVLPKILHKRIVEW